MALSDPFVHTVQELFCADRYDDAIACLRTALEADGREQADRAEINKLLGRIFYYRHEFRVAKEHLEAALSENPTDLYALFYLAHTMLALGNRESAFRLYAECMDRSKTKEGIACHVSALARSFPFGDASIASIVEQGRARSDNADASGPKVSVIILCYNKLGYTIKCLSALFANTEYPNLEVLVVDNASVDDTPGYLEMFSRKITFIQSRTNLGFVGGNNLAARQASGEILVFLNNDTEVQKGWLTEMLGCMAAHPDAGAVGARLLSTDRTVQEAGGIIFADGNGWNYGRGFLAKSSLVSFVREVDYCSGAALMVRADLFKLLGGFDERYAPAYCEDSDLCFALRELGFKVYYCPTAAVIHHEGVTAGKDVTKGFKRFQEVNLPKFRERWQHRLGKQHANEQRVVFEASRRSRTRSVLIIDDWPPLPDKASGTLRMYNTLKEMVKLGWQVTYAHLVGANLGPTSESYLMELRALGVEFIWLGYEQWWALRNSPDVRGILRQIIARLDLKTRAPDFVYLSFWFVAEYFMDFVREELPDTPIIIDTHDLHYLREARQADLLKDKKLQKEAQEKKRRELAVYSKADCVTTVTEEDRHVLMTDLPSKPVFIMTNIHEPEPSSVPFGARKDLLFVGNFNHAPNQDAVTYFVERIFPIVRRSLPGVQLLVVGNNPPPGITSLQGPDITVTGWVPSLTEYFDRCRLSVVPIRYGAGVKGKVGEAIAHGLPCVMTTIAAEGMNIVDGKHALIADDPEAFSAAVVKLYGNEDLWSQLVRDGLELVKRQYSADATRNRLAYITSFNTRASFTSYRALRYPTPPQVSIILATYNQIDYTRQCLDSIRRHTRASHEIIVVDNGSTDGTVDALRQYPEVRLIRNAENKGFPAAVNQGIAAAVGEDVLLLNNDAVVTDGWLERLLEVAHSQERVGIVGPMSNRISGAQFDQEAKYATIDEMHAYAAAAAKRSSGQTQVVPRVAFFCTLMTRDVLEAVGGVDERFTPGNYEDDDYCLRANIAGFKSVVAKDVFVHHFGSKSFLADGKEKYRRRLETNLHVFSQKWGGTPEEIWTLQKRPAARGVHIPVWTSEFLRWFDRARAAIEEGSLPDALACVTEAISHYHDADGMSVAARFDELLCLAGSIAARIGERDIAAGWYRQAIGIAPNSTKALTGHAQLLLAGGAHEEARRLLARVLELDPENSAALQTLASSGQGTPDIRRVESEGSSHGLDERLNEAQRLFGSRQYREAIASVASVEEDARSLSDESHRQELISAVENFRGVCYLSLKELEPARRHFEQSLRLRPDSSRACAGLGEVFFLSHRFDASKTMFEWAVKNDPGSTAAVEGLAQANMALGLDREHNTLLVEARVEGN